MSTTTTATARVATPITPADRIRTALGHAQALAQLLQRAVDASATADAQPSEGVRIANGLLTLVDVELDDLDFELDDLRDAALYG